MLGIYVPPKSERLLADILESEMLDFAHPHTGDLIPSSRGLREL